MELTLLPAKLQGTVAAIPSKSHAHRLLIASALSDGETKVGCPAVSRDISATADCLRALCADVHHTKDGFTVSPRRAPNKCVLDCGESGSTYRFLLPVACALGVSASFLLSGRLPERPMDALFEQLEQHGIAITGKGTNRVSVSGRLTGGVFTLPGNVSSQFISGLCFALPRTGKSSTIAMAGELESKGYVEMTLATLRQFGIHAAWHESAIHFASGQRYVTPKSAKAEGDWSNAAFWLCAAAACQGSVTVTGLDEQSPQGDRAIREIIESMTHTGELLGCEIDIRDIPDLAPALALLGVAAKGVTTLTGAGRLRLKESDRIASIVTALGALGANIQAMGDEIVIHGTGRLKGGRADAANDHRIAMMLGCAAAISDSPVTIAGAEAVEKSYPHFFSDLATLGVKGA